MCGDRKSSDEEQFTAALEMDYLTRDEEQWMSVEGVEALKSTMVAGK